MGAALQHHKAQIALIEARRQAEEAARLSHEAMLKAQAADRAKTEFLANMSHELRTPLNAIIGFSDMISDDVLKLGISDTYREYAVDIRASGGHLLKIINDVLDFSKIEAGVSPLHEEEFSLMGALRACTAMVKGRAEAARVALIQPDDAGNVILWGDEQKIRQVVINLLANAIKFTQAGGRVAVAWTCDDAGLVVTVCDSGIGIPAEHIDRVLEPFCQVDSALSRKFEGTGLGLTLSQAFVKQHGGHLRIESTVGLGTKVSIHLPATRIRSGGRAVATASL